tara:strand:+ start:690 stop:1649 length:960 start_codon:yes stop_codon:yes gene_type:complete
LNFCTHFDSNYLPHALTLASSLERNAKSYKLFMICMDDKSYKYLNDNPLNNVQILHIKELEKKFPLLKIAKLNRNRIEYFFTCSPAVCNYVMDQFDFIDSITYLDADLYFFSDPKKVFDEIENNSIAIIEHRFHWTTKRQLKYGRFNVGWVTFKNDSEGKKCLIQWMENCLDWCYQKVEKDRFGDQKYLNRWPSLYKNLYVIQNKGANVAIWNIPNYHLSFKEDKIFIDNQQLIFYHFANIDQINKSTFNTNLSRVFINLKGILLNKIYIPYLRELKSNMIFNDEFISKKDNHISGLKYSFIDLSRKIRSFFFKDLVEL